MEETLTISIAAPTARILLVDDNAVVLHVVSSQLAEYDCLITTATGGREALDILEREEFDLILMDHMMPGMDGIETVGRLRRMEQSRGLCTPVIALTGNLSSGSREMFLSHGFQDYLPKPVDAAELDRIMRQYLPDYRIIERVQPVERKQERKDALSPETVALLEASPLFDYREAKRNRIDPENLVLFSKSAEKAGEELGVLYFKKEWKAYTIMVHALKTSSRMVGAMGLSELAEQSETASKEADEERVKELHPILLEQLEEVLRLVRQAIQIEKEKG
ncbi:MAG: response regulator [Lachnospiraceae bacterium]|nr:response regulator [Lachnospiraceae bacterium]